MSKPEVAVVSQESNATPLELRIHANHASEPPSYRSAMTYLENVKNQSDQPNKTQSTIDPRIKSHNLQSRRNAENRTYRPKQQPSYSRSPHLIAQPTVTGIVKNRTDQPKQQPACLRSPHPNTTTIVIGNSKPQADQPNPQPTKYYSSRTYLNI